MDVATKANIMVTGHDKELKLWRLPGLEQIECKDPPLIMHLEAGIVQI